MCETWIWADENFTAKKPANTNFRHFAEKIFNAVTDQETWYGIEQEYSLLEVQNKFTIKPLGWPSSGFPGP
jgi:glutamine synthetase